MDNTNEKYDCIVLGLGGVGSSALLYAAKKGWRVLGLDQFAPGHDRGSSHGKTRIIRTAYFEHPDYVPLAQKSRQLWGQLEAESKQNLLTETSLLQVGKAGSGVIDGVMASVNKFDLPVEILKPSEAQQHYPWFQIEDDEVALVEQSAGYLRVEKCVNTQIELAVGLGAEVLTGAVVSSWDIDQDTVVVSTSNGGFVAERLIVCGGAWSKSLLEDLELPLTVKRKSQFWFDASSHNNELRSIPTFYFETDQGCYYGFPWIEGDGIKIAEHTGGHPVADPLAVHRDIDPEELARINAFAAARFPNLSLEMKDHSVCMYTMSSDEHFLIDSHPRHPNVVFAAGLSGHGFKFTPFLGHYLIALLCGEPSNEMEFLKLKRLSKN